MDVFTGDRQITIPDEFPPQLVPFPEPTDFFFSHQMDVIHSPEIFANSSTSPPHKLRPVRFNVRSPVSDSPENRWLFETGGEGLFSNFGCDVNRQLECLSESENVEPPKSVICGNILGQYSGTIAEERNSNSQERVQEDEYR